MNDSDPSDEDKCAEDTNEFDKIIVSPKSILKNNSSFNTFKLVRFSFNDRNSSAMSQNGQTKN
jgi:hypothetical protein